MTNDKSKIQFGFISKNLEQAKEDITNFVCSIDADMSGDNGKDYTSESAIELGYDSTISYLVGESKATDVESLVKEIMGAVVNSWVNYSDFTDYNYQSLDDDKFVIAWCCK